MLRLAAFSRPARSSRQYVPLQVRREAGTVCRRDSVSFEIMACRAEADPPSAGGV